MSRLCRPVCITYSRFLLSQPPMTDFMAVLADVAPVKGLRWLLKHPSNPVVARLLGIFLTRAPDTAGLVRAACQRILP